MNPTQFDLLLVGLVVLAGLGVIAAFRSAYRVTRHTQHVTRMGGNLVRALGTAAVIVGMQWAVVSFTTDPARLGRRTGHARDLRRQRDRPPALRDRTAPRSHARKGDPAMTTHPSPPPPITDTGATLQSAPAVLDEELLKGPDCARRPLPAVLPPWLRSRRIALATLRWAIRYPGRHLGFHLVRAPGYARAGRVLTAVRSFASPSPVKADCHDSDMSSSGLPPLAVAVRHRD